VVGGGIVGTSVARHLAHRGVSVILLEQNSLTSGSTWHAAGLLGTSKASTLIASLARYGSETYRQMNDEAGRNLVGWTNTGSLGIARCADSMEQLVRTNQMALGIGHKQHRIVSPSEIKEIHPFLKTDGIVGGLYSPEDGICNPGDVAMMMAKDAREHGAVVLERTECASITFDKDLRRVSHVQTDRGEKIVCGSIALCGGAWTKKLSRLIFGENRIPVAMVPHQYVIFDKTEGVGGHLPVVRDIRHKYYLKPEVGGFMLGIFEGEPLPHLPTAVRERNSNTVEMPRNAENEIYEESFDKAGEWLEAAMNDVPILNEVGMKQWLHGPDTHSADHSPLIGRVPGSDNVYVGTGFNSQGIQCGPGAGLAIAETILDGAPHSIGCDFASAEPSRIYPGLCEDAEWVEMRAAEGYGKTYSVHYPLEMFESARNRRLSPVHAELLKLGAVFGETYGWERPLYFPTTAERRIVTEEARSPWEDPSIPGLHHTALSFNRTETEFFQAERRECTAARKSAALFDLSSFGKIRVSGPRALEVLQKCMTADMDKIMGAVTYTLFCDPRGGILGDLTVARLGVDDFYIVTLSNQPGKVVDQLHRIAIQLSANGYCNIEDVTEAKGVLAVNGPRSFSILKELCPTPLDNENFPPGTAQHINVAGLDMLALRVSFAGELGLELHCDASDATKLYTALLKAGSEHGLVPAGLHALLNSLRTEKGFMHYGADIGLTETPLEAGLGFACKLKPEQPDFVGKAAILKQRKDGWKKRLVCVKAAADITLWGHEQELLYRDGELVGSMTSGAHSHTLGKAIGMGYIRGPPKVPKSWLDEGTYEVEVPVRTSEGVALRRFPVDISMRCFVDPQGERIRAV